MKKTGRGRSKSRGRSPARAKSTKSAKKDTVDSAKVEKPKESKKEPEEYKKSTVETKVLKAETPTRISKRIAAKAISDAFSDDESEKVRD